MFYCFFMNNFYSPANYNSPSRTGYLISLYGEKQKFSLYKIFY